MAVDKQTRTPLPNGASSEKPNGFVPAAVENIEKPGDIIQVPSSAPPVDDNTVAKQSQGQNGHHSNGNSRAIEDHDEPMSPATASELDPSELPPFNWEDFHRRNFEEMKKLDEEENALSEDFDKLAQVCIDLQYKLDWLD